MGEEFVEIYQGGGGQFRGEMLRSLLSGSGIEAIVRGAAIGLYPTNVGVSGEFAILVRANDADRAADLIRSFEEEGVELEEIEWEDDDGEEEAPSP
ncbi:MAG TPA: DUF2007 domain-containing protein [Actinomycetota bacterium]|nr:DUF2007 domain-containing protein [Actinomycetota bacterium]